MTMSLVADFGSPLDAARANAARQPRPALRRAASAPRLHRTNALFEAGARVGWELDELLVASQCDLLVTGMLRGFEDYAEVPPVNGEGSEGWAACGLLRWALTGAAPQRYRPYASSNPLLAESDAKLFMGIVRDLRAGSHGLGLVGYGTALMALAR